MVKHGLSADQLSKLLAILAPFSNHIEKVGLFGSRATGTSRPNSDVDLVLYGDIDSAMVNRLWTLFDESTLALKVDINAYDLITYPPLKAHIDSVMQPLFSQKELLEAKKSST